MKNVAVTGSFDNLDSRRVRFLEEASKLGRVHALVSSDETVLAREGMPAKFPEQERLYMVQVLRFVSQVTLIRGRGDPDGLPAVPGFRPDVWAEDEVSETPQKRSYCDTMGLDYRVFRSEDLKGFPVPRFDPAQASPSSRKQVLVTGCFDWFHSGHVRFFEEVSELGDLYAVVGHDANVRLLKGPHHPLFPQQERLYMVHAVRYVKHALLSTGHGWMDAEPEISLINPDIYVVNEDGDKPEKRAFCAAHGLEYVVLKRRPKPGLPPRQSTDLRGF
jgi:cytidyltransferase-like protein